MTKRERTYFLFRKIIFSSAKESCFEGTVKTILSDEIAHWSKTSPFYQHLIANKKLYTKKQLLNPFTKKYNYG